MSNTVGGSADLTGSNNTKTKTLQVFSKDNRSGRYIHYGIREHGMASIMNGMALHGGIIPYGGTFLTFSEPETLNVAFLISKKLFTSLS